MKIVIIDGQGGRMGKAVIEQLKSSYPELELYAIGTNSNCNLCHVKSRCLLWSHRRKSCDRQCQKRGLIIGPIGIVMADSLMGRSLLPWRPL